MKIIFGAVVRVAGRRGSVCALRRLRTRHPISYLDTLGAPRASRFASALTSTASHWYHSSIQQVCKVHDTLGERAGHHVLFPQLFAHYADWRSRGGRAAPQLRVFVAARSFVHLRVWRYALRVWSHGMGEVLRPERRSGVASLHVARRVYWA